MGIKRISMHPGSTMVPNNVYITQTPASDPAGIFDGLVSVNTQLTFDASLNSYVASIFNSGGLGAGTGCILRMPVVPCIIATTVTDTWTFLVTGYDQFGRQIQDIWKKDVSNRLVQLGGIWAFSVITSVVCTQASNPGVRVRIGFMYSGYAVMSATQAGLNTGAINQLRAIPLPVDIQAAADVASVYALGSMQKVSQGPAAPTFTATTAVSAGWDLSTAITGIGSIPATELLAVTSDGYIGQVTAVNDGTDTVTVTAWLKDGVPGTPGVSSAAQVSTPAVWLMRGDNGASLINSVGGLAPGLRMNAPTAANLASSSAGASPANAGAAIATLAGPSPISNVFGYFPQALSVPLEPMKDQQYLVTLDPRQLL